MEMLRNYVKLPFNIKLIILSCLTIITWDGYVKIIKFPYTKASLKNLEVVEDKKILKLHRRINNTLLLVIIGIILSFILSQIEKNKLLIYGYIFYCMLGSFYVATFYCNNPLSTYLINRYL